jgi:hypothetical protein
MIELFSFQGEGIRIAGDLGVHPQTTTGGNRKSSLMDQFERGEVMKKYYMGIDNGGTLCKAVIFDTEGQEISSGSCKLDLETPFPGAHGTGHGIFVGQQRQSHQICHGRCEYTGRID